MLKILPVAVFSVFTLVLMEPALASETIIPTTYEAGHFFAVPQTVEGRTLRFVVDTGGGGAWGLMLIAAEALPKINTSPVPCDSSQIGARISHWPAFSPSAGLPHTPSPTPCGAMALIVSLKKSWFTADGIMGAGYMSQFDAWHFNYPEHRLSIENIGWTPPVAKPFIPLGFPKDAHGNHSASFPSVDMKIDGQNIAMLLDTGATAMQTLAGHAATGAQQVKGQGTTSYITTSTLNAWHAKHPQWHIISDGDGLMHTRLIEVPTIEFGPYIVKSVWFTERRDRNFSGDGIGQYMDRPIYGALGANILSHFDLIIDYRHEHLIFLNGPV